MATYKYELVDPPSDSRAFELWLQHAAGFILIEDARRYAIEKIDPALSEEARAAAQKAIDDALYGLMMVIDGVSGVLANQRQQVTLDLVVRLTSRKDDSLVSEINLFDGDGMCMGFHGWRKGDFGKNPVAKRKKD